MSAMLGLLLSSMGMAILGIMSRDVTLLTFTVISWVVYLILYILLLSTWRNREEVPFNELQPGRVSKLLMGASAFVILLGSMGLAISVPFVISGAAGEQALPKNYTMNGAFKVGDSKTKKVAVLYGMGQKESSELLTRINDRLAERVKSGDVEVSYMYVLPPGADRNVNVIRAISGTMCAASLSDTDPTAYMRFVAEMGKDVDGSPIAWGERARLGDKFNDCFYGGEFEDITKQIISQQKAHPVKEVPPHVVIIGDDAVTAELQQTLEIYDSKAGK